MKFSRLSVGLVIPVTALSVVAGTSPVTAATTTHSHVVSAIPASYTPNVNDGTVFAIGQSGSTIVLGGSFTSVSPSGGGATYPVDNLAAFTAGTGDVLTGFVPSVNGKVNTIIAGPTDGTVYVGGNFSTIDGVQSHLALIDTSTGNIVPGWTSPSVDANNPKAGNVNALVLLGNQLFVGGDFTRVAGSPRVGLAVLNATTGALDNYATPTFVGHHNYGRQCDPNVAVCAGGFTGIRNMDINSAGTRMVADGDFTTVDGVDRDQVALLDLGPNAATVDASWATAAYTSPCHVESFDSYVRHVQFSPDGSYFVIVATGGGFGSPNSDGTQNSCDSAARFETTGAGTNVRPTWIDYTGNDTFLSVALTGTVVYVGGHQRWVNNSNAKDKAKEGSVPRPGLVALDPINGMPLAWNPGRDPRGAGAFGLLATPDGLYVGSDTNYIGPHQYLRKKIAFFPLDGGATLASNQSGSLPGDVYLLGSGASTSTAQVVRWNGVSAPITSPPLTDVDWSATHGAFEINNEVYYGSSDGNFYQRSFDGMTFGPAVPIDPYDDPVWSDVQTGSGQTYRGVVSNFYGQIPTVTSMFYSGGRVYYTLSGHPHMHWRWFEPDSGVMGADEFTTTDGIDWSNVAGAFLSGSTLYFASTVDHDLYKVAFTDGEPQGAPSLADSSIDWTSLGSFVVQSTATTTGLAVTPDAQANQNEPVTMTATVSMQLDPSSHPNGTVQFDHNGTRLGSAAVDPSTGKATLTITTLPPTAPNGTVLTASFQPADSTAGGSDSAPVGYTINPVARIPHISGKVRVGNVAHCIEPTTADESSAYAWKINGKKVATGVAFRVPSGTRGKRLACTASIWIGAGPISKARSVNVTIRKRAAH